MAVLLPCYSPILWWNRLWRYSKESYFFFYCKSSFFSHFGEKSIEWMKKLYFFFPATKKKYSFEIDWMNGMWTFTGKKKHTKNTQKFGKKKTHPTFIKNKEKPSRSWINGSWTFSGKKKIHPCIFFFRFAEKKNTKFCDLIDWLTHELFRDKKKIRYLSLTKIFFRKAKIFFWRVNIFLEGPLGL